LSTVGPAALELEGLTFAYARGEPALEDVSFTVPAGTFTALLGPNGAGKTTLMSLVTRLFEARAGSIRVHGLDLRRQPRAALAAMGVVFQRPTLDVDLSVEQNLRYAAALQGIPRSLAGLRIERCLARVDMDDRRGTPVRTLSGGMRRRVEIARALLHEPRLLILDEPTVGLDIASRRSIVEHVHGLCATDGLAVLWATHLIDEIWPDDRVVVLRRGRVQAVGGLDDILAAAGASSLSAAYARLTEAATPRVVAA
jgi:ABC-2 type transport system ATP-binding protein